MPRATLVTTPLVPIVATAVLLLVHVPPVTASVSVVVCPTHNPLSPLIAGAVLMVTVLVATHPAPATYDITEIPPAMPVTLPELSTVASAVLLLLQVPPVVASASVVVCPAHTVAVPVIAALPAFTVKLTVLPLVTFALQPMALVIEFIVTVVLPAFASAAVVNEPRPALVVIVAEPLPVFAPLSEYCTVYVAVPRVDELTDTTDPLPVHGAVADGVLNTLTFGSGFTVTTAVEVHPGGTV